VLEEGDPEWTSGLFPSFVIVYGDARRNFLEGYTMQAIEEVDEKISKLPRGSKGRRMLERMFSGQAVTLQSDDTGRIVLSPKLREKLGLDGEAVFIASGDTFQVWHPNDYKANTNQMDDWYGEYDDDFDPLTLLDAGVPEE
jgi:MraZ protein